MDNSFLKKKIIDIMRQEYQQEINTKKPKDQIPNSQETESLGFADITVWFYKKNSQQSLEEARHIWDLLPSNQGQHHYLLEYLNVYADQIFDKHEKYCYYQKKYRKVENIINRTQDLIASLRSCFNKINEQQNLSAEHGIGGAATRDASVVPETLKFSVYFSGLENYSPNLARDLIGYHVEIGYQNNVASSGIQEATSQQIDFQGKKVDFTFSVKEGSIFMNLYEDFMENGERRKAVVAKRNLDLFTNISEKYLNNIIGLYGDDIELSADFDEMKFEPFTLKKIAGSVEGEGSPREGKEENVSSDEFVRLNLAIVVDKFRKYEDLQVYYRMMMKRKEHLESEMRNIKLKANGYKKKLALILLPFSEIITFDEKALNINKKFEKKQPRDKKPCMIF